MKCAKCGAEWTTNISNAVTVCPFCGEPLMGVVPHQQAIEALKIILDRFGVDIYFEDKRLYGLVNDLLPNTATEKGILKTAITLGAPTAVAKIITESVDKKVALKECYALLENGGLSKEWCAASLFIFAMPLDVDSTELFPLSESKEISKFNMEDVAVSYDQNLEDEYSSKSMDDLLNLALGGDAVACTELGERYYSGTNTEKDIDTAIAYFTQAADMGYSVAEFILGKLYDEGQSVPHDGILAFEYYKKAADKEYPPAEYALGQMYYFGQDCEKNDQEALYWISKAAKELDDSDAYVVLAMVLKESEDEDVKDEGKAFLYAKRAAEMGDENAYNLLGTMYELGCGVEQSYENAIKYYKLAAENGVEIAFLNIGAFYQAGIGVPKDDRKAVEYFQAGANAGNMYCLNALGMCYKNGTGVQQDYKKAFGLFLDAAYASNFAGELNTGLAYDEGQGVQEDKAEAKKWFTLAASHGSSKAMVALGFYTEKGIPDGEPDLESAFEWYLKAAEVGDHPFAAWVVGNCYSQGLMGVEIDRCTAFKWYLLAAELGQATAQNNVACDYLKGEIVDLDSQAAVEWFEKAVAQDDMYALDNYGTILMNGDGVPRETERAFAMVKKAADMGYADAMLNAGVCYFEGWGTQRNLDAALHYLTAALEAGNQGALSYLQKGFKEKNGMWTKRGFFGKVPAPEQLPPPSDPLVCKGGCENFCTYANMSKAEEIYDSEEFCYCELLDQKVFRKTKCPYYKDSLGDLLKAFTDTM